MEATTITCSRCGQERDAPPATRVPFSAPAREKVLGAICAACWKEWESMEIKVLNEYRFSLMDPQHRARIQAICLDFLGLA